MESTNFKRSDPEYVSISQLLGVDLGDKISLAQLSQRQGVNAGFIYRLLPEAIKAKIKDSDLETALADLLYRGYLVSQHNVNERIKHNDNLKIPEKINFHRVNGLSIEMIERLERSKPQTFGQIRNISGLTPSAISTLLVYLTSQVSN